MADKANEKKNDKATEKNTEKTAVKKTEKVTAKKTEKPVAKKADKAEKAETKVYHISKLKDKNMWQVKAEGSLRALKTFIKQEDAIEYAKRVAGNNEGRIVIHKVDGSFRKLEY